MSGRNSSENFDNGLFPFLPEELHVEGKSSVTISNKKSCSRRILFAAILCVMATSFGCEPTPKPQFRFNEVAWRRQEKVELDEGQRFDPEYRAEIGNLLTALFGTPDEPDFPFPLGEDDPGHEVVSLARLKMAAGPVKSDRRGRPAGLYREHCVHCHGITGDGAGPTAGLLNPYPRDFRMGKFKFKSTPLRRRPTDDDLKRILTNGIPGTAMPSFRSLSQAELESLVDYVKYLSIRGEYERRLIAEVSNLDGEPFVDWSLAETTDETGNPLEEATVEEHRESLVEQLYVVFREFLGEDIVSTWVDPERSITPVPAAPPTFQPDHPQHAELVEQGRSLFLGKGNCVQCHGLTGMGDGQVTNYDDWTKDWLNTLGVDPKRPETYREFLEAGALRPRPVRPRNLRLPVYRGGHLPEDLYRRIANGIEGTPMPSSPSLTPDEVWALVAFVRQLPFESTGESSPATPTNERSVN